MIMWAKHNPSKKIVDMIGAKVPANVPTISQAAMEFVNSGKLDYPQNVKQAVRMMLQKIDPKKKIDVITVGDARKLFSAMCVENEEATAYRVRACLYNSINHALTGAIPPSPVRNGDEPKENGLRFSKSTLEKVAHLVPLYSTNGRFGHIKAKIQTMVFELGAGETGIIEAPKRTMSDAEAKSIMKTVTQMFGKGKLPWVIRYNPSESVFVVLRKKDFEKICKSKLEEN